MAKSLGVSSLFLLGLLSLVACPGPDQQPSGTLASREPGRDRDAARQPVHKPVASKGSRSSPSRTGASGPGMPSAEELAEALKEASGDLQAIRRLFWWEEADPLWRKSYLSLTSEIAKGQIVAYRFDYDSVRHRREDRTPNEYNLDLVAGLIVESSINGRSPSTAFAIGRRGSRYYFCLKGRNSDSSWAGGAVSAEEVLPVPTGASSPEALVAALRKAHQARDMQAFRRLVWWNGSSRKGQINMSTQWKFMLENKKWLEGSLGPVPEYMVPPQHSYSLKPWRVLELRLLDPDEAGEYTTALLLGQQEGKYYFCARANSGSGTRLD